MTTTLQIVNATDLSTVLFDFNDPTGANNADGVRTTLSDEGPFSLGTGEAEPVVLSPQSIDGGFVVSNRTGLGTAAWKQFIKAASTATTPDTVITAVGDLGRLLAQGGVIKYIPDGSAQTRYIDFEPSPTPAVYNGQPYELVTLAQAFAKSEGIELRVLRQPFLRGAELSPSTNLVTNATLTQDFGGTANRPDDWTWTGTTGLTAETIAQVEVGGVRRGVYRFTKADGTAASLQLTTADNSYASGDVGVFSFYARVTAVAGTPQMQATLQFQTNAAGNVGGLHSGGLVALTTKWQRISVTSSAAGATTGQALVSIQIDNGDATSVVVEVCNAQAEKTGLTGFRVPAAAVAYNPASTALPRKVAVWGEGNAPSLAKLRVTSDALTMAGYRVYRVAEKAIAVLQATLHKSLRSGTLGTDTTSTADADGVDGNVAQVAYTEPDPAFGTDAGAGGTGTYITVAKPTSLAQGDFMVAYVWRGTAATQLVAEPGWQVLGFQQQTTGGNVLFVYYKTADAVDASASKSTYTWYVPGRAVADHSYTAWIGRFTNIDPVSPVDTFAFSTEDATVAPTATSLTTSNDDAQIVTIYAGRVVAAAGALTWTAPAGATPTYTEQDDRQADVTWKATAVYTGVLATAGATGTKDATASLSSDVVMCNVAFRKAPAILQTRSTVTFTSLPAGDYDVWLRYRTTALCRDRIRVGYGIKASPSVWTDFPDFVLDTIAAGTFTEYQEHLMGRLVIPPDYTLSTLTVRVQAGREQTSSANLRLDMIYLAPAFETSARIVSPTALAVSEMLEADAKTSTVYHLSSSVQLAEVGMVEGPTPVELVPGYQVLIAWPQLAPLAGFVDPATEVTAAPTVTVTHSARYRT